MVNVLEATFFDQFKKKITDRIEVHKEHVASGAAEDYANYRERVGQYQEAKEILRIYEDLLKVFEPY